ncbi:uncharacterized protein LOC122860441 [Aphidius gifuensis]|uniref:uncharacterized protein LOC122860441 n=1 Tax=Aphidius gifuensis TaxID=684658 RepID=UPI001CDBE881|nr:uncharacterized protein LOC122860441 [Aphidius gifuensis]
MDSLQAALVKLDPATTVTPIGKILKVHNHRPTFVDLDDNDLTLNNLLVNETMSKSSEILNKKKIIIPEDVVDDNEKEDDYNDTNDNDDDDKQSIHILFDIVKKCSTLEPRRYNLNNQQQQQQQINIGKCTKTEVT